MDALTAVILADMATKVTDLRRNLANMHNHGIDAALLLPNVKVCNELLSDIAAIERRMTGGQT